MKTLKFRNDLAKMILNGEKTVTWRLFDDKHLTIGDQVQLIEWETGKIFATVKITKIKEKRFGEISELDFLGHEKFDDTAQMLKHYRDYYGDHVNMETKMKVVEFKLLDDATPAEQSSAA